MIFILQAAGFPVASLVPPFTVETFVNISLDAIPTGHGQMQSCFYKNSCLPRQQTSKPQVTKKRHVTVNRSGEERIVACDDLVCVAVESYLYTKSFFLLALLKAHRECCMIRIHVDDLALASRRHHCEQHGSALWKFPFLVPLILLHSWLSPVACSDIHRVESFRKIAKSIDIVHRCFQCMITPSNIVPFGIGFRTSYGTISCRHFFIQMFAQKLQPHKPCTQSHALFVGMTLQLLVADKFTAVVLVLCNL